MMMNVILIYIYIYRFCADEEEVKDRVIRILSWCVDIVRCVPVGGCQLVLI